MRLILNYGVCPALLGSELVQRCRPVEVTGFTLKPVNFFSGNPGIDIPPERNNASKAECCKEVSIANGNGGSSSKL